jgi:hypothetical protein
MLCFLPFLVFGMLPSLQHLQQERAAALIEALGDPDIEVRSLAHEGLRKLLPGVEPELRRNAKHPDPEVAARCRDLLVDFGFLKATVRPLKGKVALSDPKRNAIAVDLRARDQAKAGDRLEVMREGRRVGVLVISEVQVWGSWAKPEADTSIDDIQKNDTVERIQSR